MKLVDLTGKAFGHLTVVGRGHKDPAGKDTFWTVECTCGSRKDVSYRNLRRGFVTSCGCHASYKRHGLSHTPEYHAWNAARLRCFSPDDKSYKNYGQRGITMCERWRDSFEAFYIDMGPKPSPELTLERRDNGGNYEPGNCKWATYAEQLNNTRWNIKASGDPVEMLLPRQ